MAAEVVMPRLSDSMDEGTVVRWLKQPGEAVEIGEEIAEIETDKATMGCESEHAGTLLEVLVAEGESAPLGAPIARIGEPGEANGAAPSSQPVPAPPSAAAEPRPAPAAEHPPRVKASPVARRLATELGVELAALTGSGPGGRVVKADVTAAAGAAPPAASLEVEPAPTESSPTESVTSAKGGVTRIEPSRLQQTVARRMAEAKGTQPEFALRTDVDMEEAVALRSRLREVAGTDAPAPSYNDLVVRACALALRGHPRANGAYRDGGFELYERVNVGVAVAAEEALLVPVIADADRLSLGEIARVSRELAKRGREGTLTAAQMSGATFTVSNLGMYGVRGFTAVLNSPQAAILAVGELAQRAAVVDGELVARHRLELNLTCDHRILYGADAAAFLARIRELLEQPLALAL